jgi:hypothetical protein
MQLSTVYWRQIVGQEDEKRSRWISSGAGIPLPVEIKTPYRADIRHPMRFLKKCVRFSGGSANSRRI